MSGCLHGVDASRCVECSSSLRRAVEELQALADANPLQGKEWERPDCRPNDGSLFAGVTPVVQPTVCPECGSSDPKKFGKKCYLIERRHVFHRSGVIDTPEEESAP